MSLINDALKRAKQSTKIRAGGSGPPPLQPHDGAGGSNKWPILVLLFVLIAGGGGYWYFFMQGKGKHFALPWFGKKAPAVAAGKTNAPGRLARSKLGGAPAGAHPLKSERPGMDVAKSSGTHESKPITGATKTAARNLSPSMPLASRGGSQESPEPLGAPAMAASEGFSAPGMGNSGASPSLKLEGIFYRMSRPSVLINGQTLYRGDPVEGIDGMRVIEIERHSVTLERAGHRTMLSFNHP